MTHTGAIIGRNDKLEVMDCEQCKFAHLFPLPTEKQLTEYYQHPFYEQDKKSWLQESEEDADWIEASLRMELAMLGVAQKSANHFLDIGAGFGQCLEYAQKLGWDAEGLEPSPFACQVLKQYQLPYQQGFIETAEMVENSAEVIRAAWVLEHLLDPSAVLEKFRKTLKPGGRLLLAVPNDFTNIQQIAQRELKKKDAWWIDKSHINYFNLRSLGLLLGKHGFQIQQFYSTYPMEMFLLQGDDYIGNQKLGRQVHARRKKFEMAMHQSAEGIQDLVHIQQAMASTGMGRDLVVMAVKIWNTVNRQKNQKSG